MGVRWDAVVDPAAVRRHAAPPPVRRVVNAGAGGNTKSSKTSGARGIAVRVRLFGALAAMASQRSFDLTLSAGATVDDVIAVLGDRLGEAFLAQVLDSDGVKRRHCRLFVAGYPVEDLQLPLTSSTDPTEIDIILLILPEGG